MVQVFVRRFQGMDNGTKTALAGAVKGAVEPVIVRSAFELPAELRAQIQDVVNRAFSADVHLRFDTAPDLVGGIELATNGHKVGWSLAGYLQSLEKGVGDLMKAKEKETEDDPNPEPTRGPKAEMSAPPRPAVIAPPKPQAAPEAKGP